MKRKSLIVMTMTAVLFLLSALNISMHVSGNAKVAEKFRLLAATSITQKESIRIPMEGVLLKTSINNGNVYVLDDSNKRVLVTVTIDSSGKAVLVKPKLAYAVGKSYTLFVSRNILYKNGKHPAEGRKLIFKVSEKAMLPSVGSLANLKKLVAEAGEYEAAMYGGGRLDVVFTEDTANKAAAAAVPAPMAGTTQGTSSDYSKTNVQVDGVDEGDIVKTDGTYIYSINNGRLNIVKAVPGEHMEQVSAVAFETKDFEPADIYVDPESNRLVVIGNVFSRSYSGKTDYPAMPYYYSQSTLAIIYDTTDKSMLKEIREVELEGNCLSSRKIGSKLYLVTNKRIYGYWRENEKELMPSYRDSSLGKEFINVKYDQIRYFPDSIQSNFLLVGVVDIVKSSKPISLSTYLGSGSNVYMSQNNLYVAVGKYDFKVIPKDQTEVKSGVMVKPGIWWPGEQNTNTLVYKFKVVEEGTEFYASGTVPGTILNQFSMDESSDTFRIATTKGNVWDSGQNMSKNNLYVLDNEMKICGSLVDMAPGEKIYSVRFLGDRAYIVTYKKVDPLFVIDLKDRTKPAILGALKIPGYSDYLHPYDENHIIGFGKDSIEIPYKDSSGKVTGTTAYYLGMKVALFDVSDVRNPREISHEIIGDRGTDSQLLQDHKALLFSKDKNLMAFPVTEFKLREGQKAINEQNGYAYPEYGAFSYQGAYVFSIDVKKGFTLRGKITHMSEEDYLKAGSYGYDYNKSINRILYIGDTLYTSSNYMLKANSLKDLKEIGNVQMRLPGLLK